MGSIEEGKEDPCNFRNPCSSLRKHLSESWSVLEFEATTGIPFREDHKGRNVRSCWQREVKMCCLIIWIFSKACSLFKRWQVIIFIYIYIGGGGPVLQSFYFLMQCQTLRCSLPSIIGVYANLFLIFSWSRIFWSFFISQSGTTFIAGGTWLTLKKLYKSIRPFSQKKPLLKSFSKADYTLTSHCFTF